jgi:hypothetical protein
MTPSHYLVVDYQDRQPDYPPLFQSTFMRLTRRSILPKKMAKSAARESFGARGRKDATRTQTRRAIRQIREPNGRLPPSQIPPRANSSASPLLGHRTPLHTASSYEDAV